MTLQLVGVAEEIFLGLDVPQAVMGLAETIELGVDRIGLALLLEFRDRCQRHLDVGVDQLFTTFDFRKEYFFPTRRMAGSSFPEFTYFWAVGSETPR